MNPVFECQPPVLQDLPTRLDGQGAVGVLEKGKNSTPCSLPTPAGQKSGAEDSIATAGGLEYGL